jgi:hypothetical protein
MQDQVNASPTPNKRVAGTGASLPERNHRCGPSTSGRSGRNFRSKVALATLPCSIRRLIANFVVATSSRSGSRMSLRAGKQRIVQRCGRKRLGGR